MSQEQNEIKKEKKTSIGGQALLEGIMMRGPKRTAMAVRNLKGEIVLEEWDTVTHKPAKIWTLPLFRGMYGMYSSMKVGYKCLMRSAELSGLNELEEEEEKEKKLNKLNKKRKKEGLPPLSCLPEETSTHSGANAEETVKEFCPEQNSTGETAPSADSSSSLPPQQASDCFSENQNGMIEEPSQAENLPFTNDERTVGEDLSSTASSNETCKTEKKTRQEEKDGTAQSTGKNTQKSNTNLLLTGAAVIGSVLGVALSILLFIYLPIQIYSWTLESVLENNISAAYPKMLLRSLFEGSIRIVIFVLYMVAVSFMKDIKRTFMYHGAEHKTIFCYEKGLPLTVENVRRMRRFHPRCGTSFMIVMLILGIVIGSFIPEFHIGTKIINNLLRSLCKIALLPITVGVGYEFIKYAGKHDNLIVKILSAPGLWMQRISTKEPDDSMIECAIQAVERVIPEDGSDSL